MRLGFLELPAEERRLYLEQAALRGTRPQDELSKFIGEFGNRQSHKRAGG